MPIKIQEVLMYRYLLLPVTLTNTGHFPFYLFQILHELKPRRLSYSARRWAPQSSIYNAKRHCPMCSVHIGCRYVTVAEHSLRFAQTGVHICSNNANEQRGAIIWSQIVDSQDSGEIHLHGREFCAF